MVYFLTPKFWNLSKKESAQCLVKIRDMFWMVIQRNYRMLKNFSNVIYSKNNLLAETEDERDEKGMIVCNEKTIPDNIIALEASDSFIKTRVMKMPDALTVGTKNSEEGNF